MSERKEPTVSSVMDDKEDLAERRAKLAKQMQRTTTSKAQSARQSPVNNGGSSGFTWFVFLVTLCAGAAAGFALWQLDATQVTIKAQRLRIVELENKLAISDDSASQSLASVSAQVRGLNSQSIQADAEIAKLWATRNVNRDGIKSTEDKLLTLDKKIEGKITRRVVTLEKQQQKMPALTASLNNVEKSVDELQQLTSSISSTSQTVAEQDILLRAIRERMVVQSGLLKTLSAETTKGVSASNKLGDIDKRLTETEEALTSLEAFRRITNRDLLQLKKPQ
ncbi:MAG: hypothetical protein ACI8VC_000947 [Candidatus Endobugula sp.]